MARKKYYRNRKKIMDVEPDSLFYKSEDGNMILVDEDQFLMTTFDSSNFYRIKHSQINRKLLYDT